MLKIYKVHNYVSIDGTDWRAVGNYGYRCTDEEPENTLILDNIAFNEAREYLSQNLLYGVWNDNAFKIFGEGKPTIKISYQNAWDTVEYRRFNTLSYKREFEEWENVTLEWMMKNLSAEKLIQYLKERGITTCPMNF